MPTRLQLLDRGDEFIGGADPPPRRHRHPDRLYGLVRDHLVLEDRHGLRWRRQQRRTGRREVRAVRHDRRLVQPGHEDVDAAAPALVERVLDVRGRGQALRLQLGGVGGGQHGGVGVPVRRMDLDRPVAGISPQLIHEEHVLRVRAVEPDAYARDHAGPSFRGSRAGRSRPVPGQGGWRDTKPPRAKGRSWRWCWGDHTAFKRGRVQRTGYGFSDHPPGSARPPGSRLTTGRCADAIPPCTCLAACVLVVSFGVIGKGQG